MLVDNPRIWDHLPSPIARVMLRQEREVLAALGRLIGARPLCRHHLSDPLECITDHGTGWRHYHYQGHHVASASPVSWEWTEERHKRILEAHGSVIAWDESPKVTVECHLCRDQQRRVG